MPRRATLPGGGVLDWSARERETVCVRDSERVREERRESDEFKNSSHKRRVLGIRYR